jgi:hypothetical protein
MFVMMQGGDGCRKYSGGCRVVMKGYDTGTCNS